MGKGLRLIDLFDNRDAKQDEARWIPPCESSSCHEHCPTCHDDECDGECADV